MLHFTSAWTLPKQLNDVGVVVLSCNRAYSAHTFELLSKDLGILHWGLSVTQTPTLILHSSHVTKFKERNALLLPSWGNRGQVFVCTPSELRSFVMFLNLRFQISELSNLLGVRSECNREQD